MREIKVKGRRKDNGEWVYFKNLLYFQSSDGEPILYPCSASGEPIDIKIDDVDSDSFREFTTKLDKNQREIYEGDVLLDKRGKKWLVCWDEVSTGFMLVDSEDDRRCFFHDSEKYEIIGNIHDDPHLMEVSGTDE